MGIAVVSTHILGCVGGFAAHTPQNMEPLTANPNEPQKNLPQIKGVDGTNANDAQDYRPGRKAAHQHNVRSPLLEAGWTKAEIRQLSRELGLPNWDKPAAACLSSRIPYGTTITLQALSQVERAEALVHSLGLRQLRVRHHDSIARIEVEPDDFLRLLKHRQQIVNGLKALGYTYVTLDLSGFRSGSMNEAIP